MFEDKEEGGEDKEESMRGFKTRDVPRPDPYDMVPSEFDEWHELFKAVLISQDNTWSKVLEWIAEEVKVKAWPEGKREEGGSQV